MAAPPDPPQAPRQDRGRGSLRDERSPEEGTGLCPRLRGIIAGKSHPQEPRSPLLKPSGEWDWRRTGDSGPQSHSHPAQPRIPSIPSDTNGDRGHLHLPGPTPATNLYPGRAGTGCQEHQPISECTGCSQTKPLISSHPLQWPKRSRRGSLHRGKGRQTGLCSDGETARGKEKVRGDALSHQLPSSHFVWLEQERRAVLNTF